MSDCEGVTMYLFGSEDYEAVRCKLRGFFLSCYLLLIFLSQSLLGSFEFLSVPVLSVVELL